MQKKNFIAIAKAYSTFDKALFKDERDFAELGGYRVVEHDDGVHILFTSRSTMPDFLIEAGREDAVISWLKAEKIPETRTPLSTFQDMLNRADADVAEHKVVEFIETVKSGHAIVKLPDDSHFNVNLIKPSLPFLDETVYYKQITKLHYSFYAYASDFRLHISPLLSVSPDSDITELLEKTYVEKPHEGSGLFF